MTRPLQTRRQLLAALLRTDGADAARKLARRFRNLADDRCARLALDHFTARIREGRVPVRDAEPAARAAAAIAATHRSVFSRAVAHRCAGLLCHLAGRPFAARRRLVDAATLLERAGELLEAGDVHRILIDVQMLAGDYTAARAAAKRAAACFSRSGDASPRRLGGLSLNVGNLHHRCDELTASLRAYSRARKLFLRGGEQRLLATVDYNRANVLATMDRFPQAREHYERARRVFVAERLPALVAQTDSAVAALDLLEGRLDECIERLEEVKSRQAKLDDAEGTAHSEIDQAEALLRSNRPEEAARSARNAERYFAGMGFDAESALCSALLAGAALQSGKTSEAVRLFRRGRDQERRRRNPIGAAQLEVGLAQAEIRAGRPERAVQLARRSAAVARKNGLRSREARALTVGAEAAFREGRSGLARRWAERALDIGRRKNELRIQLSAHYLLGRIEDGAGRSGPAYRRLRAAERCVERLRRGITSDESRLAFAVDKSEVYEALVLNRLQRGTRKAIREALVFAERGKARALAERLAERAVDTLAEEDTAAQRLLNRLKRVERQLAAAEARLENPERRGVRGGVASRVAALTGSRMKTLSRLVRTDPQRAVLAGALPPDPWRAVAALPENELVLEYVEAGGYFHLFCIDRDGVEAYPYIAPVDRVRDVADLLRFNLGKGALGGAHAARFGTFIETALRGYLTRLYDLLLAPVAQRIVGKTLRIIPHGILHGLPFHAMERDGSVVIDSCMVAYAPSLAVLGLLTHRTDRVATRPLILGIPDRAAPLIDREIDAIRDCLGDSLVFRGSTATSRAVRLSEQRPPLLHVACHGFYAENSRMTGALRLGDAWLSLPEIYTFRGMAELVVLSGCETGRGTVYSGDEWVGLVRGFLQAGARGVVASLWEVNDDGAVALMSDFYRSLASGKTLVEALTAAQRRARAHDPNPLNWAPFMALGDPGLTLELSEAA